MNLDKYLTVHEAATILQVSRQRIMQLMDRQKIRGKRVGYMWMVNKLDIMDRLAAKSAGKL